MDQLGSHHILSSVPPAQLLQRREQPRNSTLPPVLPTGKEHGQQVEGEKYAQAKEHSTNVGLSYGEGNRKVRSENTAILPMLPLDAQGPLGFGSSSPEGNAQQYQYLVIAPNIKLSPAHVVS